MTPEDDERATRERYALGPRGKRVTVEAALERAERAEAEASTLRSERAEAAEYTRGKAEAGLQLEALRQERDQLELVLRGVKEGEFVVVTSPEYEELSALRGEIAALRKQRDEYHDAAENWLRQRDLASDREEALRARVAELEQQKDDLKTMIQDLRKRAESAEANRDELVAALRHVRALLPYLPGSMYAVGRDLADGVLARYPEGR